MLPFSFIYPALNDGRPPSSGTDSPIEDTPKPTNVLHVAETLTSPYGDQGNHNLSSGGGGGKILGVGGGGSVKFAGIDGVSKILVRSLRS